MKIKIDCFQFMVRHFSQLAFILAAYFEISSIQKATTITTTMLHNDIYNIFLKTNPNDRIIWNAVN